MSKSQFLQRILALAEEKEKSYDWMEASDLYEQATSVIRKDDFLKKGETREKIGYCLFRAAFQAESNENFKNRLKSAIKANEEAVRFFDNCEDQKKLARISHCRAMAKYANSWLALDASTKKRELDQCWKLEKEVLKVSEKIADPIEVGKACNNLMMFLIDRLEVEWVPETRERIVREALDCGEKAIKILSETANRNLLANAYVLTAFFHRQAAYARGFKTETREESLKKALSYPQEALEISEEIDDAYLVALAYVCLGNSSLDIHGSVGGQETQHFEKALQNAIWTRDNSLIGDALWGLSFAAIFSARSEDNPDEARKEYKEFDKYREDAILHYSLVAQNSRIAMAYAIMTWSIEERSGMETDLDSKRQLLENYVQLGYKGVEHARLSGSLEVTYHVIGGLSVALSNLAKTETDITKKRNLLEESRKNVEQTISIIRQASAASLVEPRELNLPFSIWSLASCQVELANIEKNVNTKTMMLKDAYTTMRSARETWLEWLRSPWHHIEKPILFLWGKEEMKTGKALSQLYTLTGDKNYLTNSAEAFEFAANAYDKADVPGRLAEAYWQTARSYDQLAKYDESIENFESASESYRLAAKKIVQLRDFYMDYAKYMHAWSKLEKAHMHHSQQEYAQAKERYEKAADLHKSTQRWNYLTLNYLAWAQLEEAEDLSRNEQTEEARNLFQKAANLFLEAKESIKVKLMSIETSDEQQMASELVKASETREQYCLGRIAVEEAKILERRGDNSASSRKYASAAETFQKVFDAMQLESDRRELRPVINLCHAWEMMTKAAAEESPDLYLKASQLFDEVKEHSTDERSKLLALGHSRICKALEDGKRFEDTRDATFYSTSKEHLEAAESYYLRAGLKDASEYAKATRILFDAYMYTQKAETELIPEKKTQYYRAAEKLLQASAGSYTKAKHPGKSDEVRRLLESIKERRQLTMSLVAVIHGPAIASTTTSFSTPTPTHEQAVGLEGFEHAFVEANLTASDEVEVGQEFEIRLDLVNVAQNPGLLIRVDALVCPAFEVTKLPSQYAIENGSLDMKGRKIEPLKVESVKFSIRATETGVFNVSPQVVFVDDIGKFRTCKPKPVTITVRPKLRFEFKSETAQKVFDFLVNAFVDDYMRRRISLEKSGWKSLMQIAEQGKVPKSSVYGLGGRRGRAISELEMRGLVETRIFLGERGRGGRILKMRVFYEKETVKRYVDQRVMKIKEK